MKCIKICVMSFLFLKGVRFNLGKMFEVLKIMGVIIVFRMIKELFKIFKRSKYIFKLNFFIFYFF